MVRRSRPCLSVLLGRSDATWIAGTKLGGQTGKLNYVLDMSHFETDGHRDWSHSTKEQVNAKLKVALEGGGTVSLIANAMNLPDSQDPLGLTAEEVKKDPRQASPLALDFKTRRTLDNQQGGVVLQQPLTAADDLKLMAYAGTRGNEQFLAVPLSSQDAITSAGGVSTFDRQFAGASLLWSHATALAQGPLTLTLGSEYDRSAEARKGYLNALGERTDLKRNEDNAVASWGAFAQGNGRLPPAGAWISDGVIPRSASTPRTALSAPPIG